MLLDVLVYIMHAHKRHGHVNAKDNIAVCVSMLLCGIYVCIELMLSLYVLPAMCCQTWTLHVP